MECLYVITTDRVLVVFYRDKIILIIITVNVQVPDSKIFVLIIILSYVDSSDDVSVCRRFVYFMEYE